MLDQNRWTSTCIADTLQYIIAGVRRFDSNPDSTQSSADEQTENGRNSNASAARSAPPRSSSGPAERWVTDRTISVSTTMTPVAARKQQVVSAHAVAPYQRRTKPSSISPRCVAQPVDQPQQKQILERVPGVVALEQHVQVGAHGQEERHQRGDRRSAGSSARWPRPSRNSTDRLAQPRCQERRRIPRRPSAAAGGARSQSG